MSKTFKEDLETAEQLIGSICLYITAFTTVALFYALTH